MWKYFLGAVVFYFCIHVSSAAVADVNECLQGTHGCDAKYGQCNNYPGSYFCTCIAGSRGDGYTCTDMDECEESTHNCHQNATCQNTDGSFLCSCNTGFSGDGISCTDVDECHADLDNCHTMANCINTLGSFNCSCGNGYHGNGSHCQVIDQCKQGVHKCDPLHGICSSYPGGYFCVCQRGYMGDGFNCSDNNECESESSNDCSKQALCTNTEGSYACTCTDGYFGDGKSCKDVNECSPKSTNDCNSNATCNNTQGSYTCMCKTGFLGDGKSCEDVDECDSKNNNCSKNAACMNTNGSYTCRCNEGYSGDGRTCEDLDECAFKNNNCSKNAACMNTDGSYTCTCNEGYSGDGWTCEDQCIPKCLINAICKNMTCVCKDGYEIDNRTNECVATCKSESINGLTFHTTFIDQKAFSVEKCTNGRYRASLTCRTSTSKTTHLASFDRGSYVELPCTVTLGGVTHQNIAANESSIENQTSLVLLLVTGQNLTHDDTQNVGNFVQNLNNVLNKSQTNISTSILSNLVHTLSSVSTANIKNNDSSGQPGLIESLQSIASHLTLGNNTDITTIESENVAVVVSRPVVSAIQGFLDMFYQLNTSSNNLKGFIQPAAIFIPSEVYEIANRTSGEANSVVSIFKGRDANESGTDWVVSADVGKLKNIKKLARPVSINFTRLNHKSEKSAVPGKLEYLHTELKCVYIDPISGEYSNKGMCLLEGTTTCKSDHLTSFAMLVNHKYVPTDFALSVVSTTGCVLSLLGLCATIMVHFSARNLRSLPQTQVFLHLCIVLAVFYALFVGGVWQAKYQSLCTGISALLHYTLLSAWFWMAIYSYCVYSLLANVFGKQIKNFVAKACVVGYAGPAIIVVITLALSSTMKDEHNDEKDIPVRICNQTKNTNENQVSPLHTMYRSRHVCWITGSPQLFGFIIPCISLFLFNCTLFGMLIAKLCKRRLITKNLASKKDFNREITIAVTMLTVMGFSWIFGYLALVSDDIYYYTVMSWLFAFFSSLQGLLIFLLTAVRRAELRNVWFSPIRTSVLKPLSRLGSRVITRVHSSTGSYLIQENSSMDATSPSSQSTQNVNLPGESTSTEGNSVHFVAVSKQVCLKGKSENFGTVRVKRTAPESANISYLYPINEEKA